MRRTQVLLLALSVAIVGCRKLEVELPGGGKLMSMSFGTSLSVGEASVSTNGTVLLKNYNLDQVQALGVIAEGVAKGVASGINPVK